MVELQTILAPLKAADQRHAAQIIATLSADERVQMVLVTGSIASETADAFSDLDLGAIVSDQDAVDGVLDALPSVTGPLVHATTINRGPVKIFSALTADALRLDVLIEPLAVACRRAQPPHVVVFDRNGSSGTLRTRSEQDLAGDPSAVVAEFLRVLGLLDVVCGRGEWIVGAQGVMLLRDRLIDLFYLENGRSRTSGRKRLNADLNADQHAVLAAQPAVDSDPASVIAAHRAVADAFLPRARRLLTRRDLSWPEELAGVVAQRLAGLIELSS